MYLYPFLFRYQGYVCPGILVLIANTSCLETVCEAWKRRLLTPPLNCRISQVGISNGCVVKPVMQTHSISLPDVLCLILARWELTLKIIRMPTYYHKACVHSKDKEGWVNRKACEKSTESCLRTPKNCKKICRINVFPLYLEFFEGRMSAFLKRSWKPRDESMPPSPTAQSYCMLNLKFWGHLYVDNCIVNNSSFPKRAGSTWHFLLPLFYLYFDISGSMQVRLWKIRFHWKCNYYYASRFMAQFQVFSYRAF